MFLVLLTSASILWTVASVAAATLLVASHLSPQWLLGHPVTLQHNLPAYDYTFNITAWSGTVDVSPSLGLWLRCSILPGKKGVAGSQHCGVYATTGADLPAAQVVAMASLVTGAGIAVLAMLLVLLTPCMRVVRRKSVFNIAGSLQALAGVFSVLGLAVLPLSWSSVRVQLMCGPLASVYALGACRTGWALYAALGGTLLLLACAVGAVHVDASVSSNRAEEEIRRGNHCVCVT
ncbi:hypothetical protein HAZT_HAZT009177 [Hyalella azteca]|uniref:LHFPL tetraspan subfamily member 2a protein n=1 Tax=Hyalella azteca TaxID=294128 RepID=A0A6A0GY91_HYAAZ|nr:LHFPL tetraspan subfamily member 2a protein [Hyalella azteca]KAA0192787.1 hypothetical protein HAZT_HAZT009177 [Hyalella azteca]